MSARLEFQVLLPIVNAPFRVYWAYNPLRLDTTTSVPVPITRDMSRPAGGDYTYKVAVASFSARFRLREPRKTFRFTVATLSGNSRGPGPFVRGWAACSAANGAPSPQLLCFRGGSSR